MEMSSKYEVADAVSRGGWSKNRPKYIYAKSGFWICRNERTIYTHKVFETQFGRGQKRVIHLPEKV